ncbi:MAG: hypothetical protein KDB35_05935 [Acidimicrobiales bacterium]|nr:hypothetical protein [Acidimicrobiales bacterium]
MDDEGRPLGVDELVTALCDFWRWRSAAPELSDYHRARYELLLDELGVDPDPLVPDADRRFDRRTGDDQLPLLIRDAATCRNREASPFAGVLAAGPAFSAAYREHSRELGELVQLTRRVNESIVRWCLARLYPTLEGRTTTEARLRERGLPPERPDEFDFF